MRHRGSKRVRTEGDPHRRPDRGRQVRVRPASGRAARRRRHQRRFHGGLPRPFDPHRTAGRSRPRARPPWALRPSRRRRTLLGRSLAGGGRDRDPPGLGRWRAADRGRWHRPLLQGPDPGAVPHPGRSARRADADPGRSGGLGARRSARQIGGPRSGHRRSSAADRSATHPSRLGDPGSHRKTAGQLSRQCARRRCCR